MMNRLKEDNVNDTSISIPASILVYQKGAVGRKLCEFDGMIIHPFRKNEQMMFLEAKNTSNNPAYGRKCLKEKLDKLSFRYEYDDIAIVGFDAIWKYSLMK